MRTSKRMSSRPPMRRTFCSSKALSSLACMAMSMELISSRNRVPPLASSNRPFLDYAPVKPPFSVPKNILSSKLSGIAAQFWDKNGFLLRVLREWSASAKSSLPVPVSP